MSAKSTPTPAPARANAKLAPATVPGAKMGKLVPTLTLLALLVASTHQLYFSPLLKDLGYYRRQDAGYEVVHVGAAVGWANGEDGGRCDKVGGEEGEVNEGVFSACEKLSLHAPSGTLFAACSTREERTTWTPAVDRLSAKTRRGADYLASYHPDTSYIRILQFAGFKPGPGGFSAHGMDVVPVEGDTQGAVWVYAVNHRLPIGPDGKALDATIHGQNSTIELFRLSDMNSIELKHVKTFADPLIATPNDVVGRADGKGFWLTNDNGPMKVGLARNFAILPAALPISHTSNVAYCHETKGCKIAADGLHAANGITADLRRAKTDHADDDNFSRPQVNGTFYVANALRGGVTVLELVDPEGDGGELVKVESIPTEYPIDNLSLDQGGHLWAAGLPQLWDMVFKMFADGESRAASSAFRISKNTGTGAFFGERYTVSKMFQNNGTLASGSTSVVYDKEREIMYLSGVAAPWLTVCSMRGLEI